MSRTMVTDIKITQYLQEFFKMEKPSEQYFLATRHIWNEFGIKFPGLEKIEHFIFLKSNLNNEDPSIRQLRVFEIVKKEKGHQFMMLDFKKKFRETENNLLDHLKKLNIKEPTESFKNALHHAQYVLKILPTVEQINKILFAESLDFHEPDIKLLQIINKLTNELRKKPSREEVLKRMDHNK